MNSSPEVNSSFSFPTAASSAEAASAGASDSITASASFPSVSAWAEAYSSAHGYVSISVCLLSAAANVANVVVLTRRHMSTPTNTLLTGIALVDIVLMLSYCVFALRFSVFGRLDSTVSYSRAWISYLMAHNFLLLALHTVRICALIPRALSSLFLTVCLSLYLTASV